jgi:hypothetical protein
LLVPVAQSQRRRRRGGDGLTRAVRADAQITFQADDGRQNGECAALPQAPNAHAEEIEQCAEHGHGAGCVEAAARRGASARGARHERAAL